MTESAYVFNQKNWEFFKKDLKKLVGDTAYNNWLKKLGFHSLEKNTISLSVPTKFLRDWIVNHYADKIKLRCRELNNNIEVLRINPDGTLTHIAYIDNGKRLETSEEEQSTYQKIK